MMKLFTMKTSILVTDTKKNRVEVIVRKEEIWDLTWKYIAISSRIREVNPEKVVVEIVKCQEEEEYRWIGKIKMKQEWSKFLLFIEINLSTYHPKILITKRRSFKKLEQRESQDRIWEVQEHNRR